MMIAANRLKLYQHRREHWENRCQELNVPWSDVYERALQSWLDYDEWFEKKVLRGRLEQLIRRIMPHNVGDRILRGPGMDWISFVRPKAAAIIPWYLSGGISAANCIAAYQPKGAADLAASYINLANPGTYNAAPGTAPTWDATNGWKFDSASSQYLVTGVVPNPPADYSCIIKFTNATAGAGNARFFGSVDNTNAGYFTIYQNWGGSNVVSYWQGDAADIANVAPRASTGTLGIANKVAYRNGASEGTISAGAGSTIRDIYIAARNQDGVAGTYMTLYIQAFAVYNTPLTSTQMGLLHTAMNAL